MILPVSVRNDTSSDFSGDISRQVHVRCALTRDGTLENVTTVYVPVRPFSTGHGERTEKTDATHADCEIE